MTEDKRLGRWPLTIDIRVAWGEMDALRHVNNVAYVRYMESARIAYFERAQLPFDERGFAPILVSQSIVYRKPVKHPDVLGVGITTSKLGTTSFTNLYRMHNSHGDLVCEGESVVVWFDYARGQKTPIDDALRDSIYRFEATGIAVE